MPEPTPRIAAFVPDLMDRSRLAGIPGLVFVPTVAELEREVADIAVLDLSRAGAVDVIARIAAPRVIAFGSHVDTDVLAAARAAGCDEVMPRSAFFARARKLLG